MDSRSITSALLSFTNDGLVVRPYAHGHLVTLPLCYYDEDRVTLFVEDYQQGFRVTDRGLTAVRLQAADLNLRGERVIHAWERSTAAAQLFNPAAEELEIAGWGTEDELPSLVFRVAEASLRIDQLRWLARERPPRRFSERVLDRLSHAASSPEEVIPQAPLLLRSGRLRQVTAAVGPDEKHRVYVQAIAGQNNETQERAVEHCFYLFELARDVPKERRLAFATGTEDDWKAHWVTELGGVCDLAFDAQQDDAWLKRFLGERIGAAPGRN